MRGAVGLALYAHAMLFLALIGQLRPVPIILLTIVSLSGTTGSQPVGLGFDGLRARRSRWVFALVFALTGIAMFLLALLPPIAFDETLYHLPFVREFARDGALHFLPELRFPVFPVLHELLCVPVFLLAGDVATHLVTLAQVLFLVALLAKWDERAGWLAAAIFLGSPLFIHFSTVLYVDMALTLFIAAGFYALDKERPALAGFLLGTACAVKYLGWYFLVAALLIVIVRRVSVSRFAIAAAIAALPTTIWITVKTGDPFFPFLGNSSWAHPSRGIDLIGMSRVLWDVTFARERMNQQPPITPFLIGCVLLILAAATHNTRARWLVALSAVYLIAFSFLPQDSRYLMPLLPLISIAAALIVVERWPKLIPILTLIAIAPGLAYAGYRLTLTGIAPEREAWLTKRVPEYRALRRAGHERIYVCGAEQLKGHAQGVLLGDHFGPYAYNRMLRGDIAERLKEIDVRYLLVAKRNCTRPLATDGMKLVYEDEVAQLWLTTPAAPR